MRISGGAARGIPLRVPRGADFRPAMDRLRQGVFSSLGARVEGARFLDFFAGTGSYGLEAFSRGAAGGVCIEQDRVAVAALRANLAAVCRSAGRHESDVVIANADARLWTPPANNPGADLIFCDPPFADIPQLDEMLFRRFAGFIERDPPGLLIFEMPGELELSSPGWRFLKRIGRGRGQPTCCLYAPEE
jgi:16S rRNA (guanine966-N2)-methyltransferase